MMNMKKSPWIDDIKDRQERLREIMAESAEQRVAKTLTDKQFKNLGIKRFGLDPNTGKNHHLSPSNFYQQWMMTRGS